ncbi:unnamed protein product [Rotaria sp. Silwood2]|nr:unnamed protein product [Rotaria sp. Silwood2]
MIDISFLFLIFIFKVIITLVVGSKIQNPVTDDYNSIGDSILMCTIALQGFIKIMPMMFAKLKQTREEIIGFNVAVFLGLTTCAILNILWCWSVLEIIPQRSVCLPSNFNQSIPMVYDLFHESPAEDQCIYSPSLEK